MKTKIKQNVFGSWRVMYSEKENIFDYKDFSTQEEAQEYEQKLKMEYICIQIKNCNPYW